MSLTTTTEIDAIREELDFLANRVRVVETQLGCNGSALPPSLNASSKADVRRITQELFPGECEFTNEFDPEYPTDQYIVVNVEATGNAKEIVDRSCRWHERIRQLSLAPPGTLRLSIMPC